MAISINNNLGAFAIQRQLSFTSSRMAITLERLSSGYKINRASDNAVGLAISERMRSQIRGMQQGIANAQLGVSMAQTADGALGEVTTVLNRIRELAVEAGSNTLSAEARTAIGAELTTLRAEIDNIAARTRFNGNSLLTGALSISTASTIGPIADGGDGDTVAVAIDVSRADASATYNVTVNGNDVTITNASTGDSQLITVAGLSGDGATQTLDFDTLGVSLTLTATQDGGGDGDISAADIAAGLDGASVVTASSGSSVAIRVGAAAGDNITVNFDTAILARTLGSGGSEDIADLVRDDQAVSTVDEANTLLGAVDAALSQVSAFRTRLGASENQLGYAISNVTTTMTNLTQAESNIRDADIAAETVTLAQLELQLNAQIALLVQSNKLFSESVLRLITGA
ncbi:MAG: flagellin [Dehalococcoidia bacterium]